MTEFTVGGHVYRAGRLDAMRAFHVTRRLTPIMSALAEMVPAARTAAPAEGEAAEGEAPGDAHAALIRMLEPVLGAVARLPDADVDYVLAASLGVCSRKVGELWAPVWPAGAPRPMYDDITMPEMIQIAFHVLKGAIGPFLAGGGLTSFASAPR
ncbi:phage tail assembly chaperone [Salinarimonas soli]|uniref:Uncharacterized protein n=1 Tax=Salinarimonas soli TaxID=1638099 RepID=A0A5B2VGM5_9HYPH|nr:hypothetical protein [Salinarimonas soli]KAA2237670.1 hypothetical protein F0L46_08290 [Salinarimonas soli]